MWRINDWLNRMRKARWWLWAGGAAVLVVLLVWRASRPEPEEGGITFAVTRGPLAINVIEGGSIEALESQDIKCEVRGSYQGVKILKIVDEGYQVTAEDVRTNKVLVELDSSEIEKELVEQEIRYQSAAASLAEAEQGYEIQVVQNLSDIKAAEQKARFARMDFDKFLGEGAAEEILARLDLTHVLESLTNIVVTAPSSAEPLPALVMPADQQLAVVTGPLQTGDAVTGSEGASKPEVQAPSPSAADKAESTVRQLASLDGPEAGAGSTPMPAGAPEARSSPGSALADLPPALLQPITVDFVEYASIDRLGDGEAMQKLRKFQDDLMVARRELEQARSQQEGTRRLFNQGFVTRIDMERDDLALTNSLLKVQTADTAQELFLKYEFAKSSEQSLSAFLEGARELDRARRSALSKLAQADARLKSAQAQYNVQLRHRRELMEQLEKCTIYAKKTGLVVYGGGDERYWRGEEQIREGATVRERQSIVTIPDMNKMSVQLRIHESYIKKVKKGQRARIKLDAFPEETLEGEVTYVAVLPDSENRWMNPDMKVYRTTVAIEGVRDWLKPGMSAKAEIMVDQLADVLYVPIQAVISEGDQRRCYVIAQGAVQPRDVKVGQFNDSFIEVQEGLAEGDLVSLRPPGREAPASGDQPPEPEAAQPKASSPVVSSVGSPQA